MTDETPALPEVAEGVRATIAAYTHALDDGRVDDVVATFCHDGSIDIPGIGTFGGHEALREAYARWVPRAPQRHLVTNTVVVDWDAREARAVSDVVLVAQVGSAWQVQFVARYHDTLHREGREWKFHRREVR